jgi:hypothetical protein
MTKAKTETKPKAKTEVKQKAKKKSFKMINCSGNFETQFEIGKDKDGKDKIVKKKFKDGIVEASGQEEINFFADRPDFVDISTVSLDGDTKKFIEEKDAIIAELTAELKKRPTIEEFNAVKKNAEKLEKLNAELGKELDSLKDKK